MRTSQDRDQRPPNRRGFPSPWTVRELEACFVVIDSDGQKLAFIYHWAEPGQRAATKLPTKCGTTSETIGFSSQPVG
jgi:hypothetical protein